MKGGDMKLLRTFRGAVHYSMSRIYMIDRGRGVTCASAGRRVVASTPIGTRRFPHTTRSTAVEASRPMRMGDSDGGVELVWGLEGLEEEVGRGSPPLSCCCWLCSWITGITSRTIDWILSDDAYKHINTCRMMVSYLVGQEQRCRSVCLQNANDAPGRDKWMLIGK